MNQLPYYSLSNWLKTIFGEPVRKITLDAGLGCPNRDGSVGLKGCVYCNHRGSGTGQGAEGKSIEEQVDAGIASLSKRYKCKKFIAYFQSFTNTYAPVEKLRAMFSAAILPDEVVGLSIGTRPDCVPDPVLDMIEDLSKNKLVWIEYGLQSIHEGTLRFINRGHGPEAFFDAVKRTKERNILVVVHLILGLPGESITDMVDTARAVAAAGVDGVKLHPLYIIRGTPLERLYMTGKYNPLTAEQAIEATLAVLREIPEHIVIHRLTSDPHPEELIAPAWMLDKAQVRAKLQEALRLTGTMQGSDTRPHF